MEKAHIGFIGMGIMEMPMAGHLSSAGYALMVYDKQNSAARQAAADISGVAVAQTPAEVAAGTDIVITMVPNGRVVREVALGENGLIHGFRKGALLVDTSSSKPWITKETAQALAQKGVDMVDAPVSGARAGAEAGSLVFMVGGEEGSVERATPCSWPWEKKIFHLGPTGSGHSQWKCIKESDYRPSSLWP